MDVWLLLPIQAILTLFPFIVKQIFSLNVDTILTIQQTVFCGLPMAHKKVVTKRSTVHWVLGRAMHSGA